MSSCLNPDCDREPIGVGVCFSCANDESYKPKVGGVQVEGGED